jgi:hypothetical protein
MHLMGELCEKVKICPIESVVFVQNIKWTLKTKSTVIFSEVTPRGLELQAVSPLL